MPGGETADDEGDDAFRPAARSRHHLGRAGEKIQRDRRCKRKRDVVEHRFRPNLPRRWQTVILRQAEACGARLSACRRVSRGVAAVSYISRRFSSDRDIVTSSANSKSLPTGIPIAILVTRGPSGFNKRERYTAVRSEERRVGKESRARWGLYDS